ncbi:hypothetical protein SK128_017191, partial [Halocaridina rubra]
MDLLKWVLQRLFLGLLVFVALSCSSSSYSSPARELMLGDMDYNLAAAAGLYEICPTEEIGVLHGLPQIYCKTCGQKCNNGGGICTQVIQRIENQNWHRGCTCQIDKEIPVM